MMSLGTIQALSSAAAKAAKKSKLAPLELAEVEDVDQLGACGYRIPNLGDYRPKGWKLVDQWLCDGCGLGGPGERALTQGQLKARLKEKILEGKSFGYGMIEEGQFQVLLGVFEKEEKKTRVRKVKP